VVQPTSSASPDVGDAMQVEDGSSSPRFMFAGTCMYDYSRGHDVPARPAAGPSSSSAAAAADKGKRPAGNAARGGQYLDCAICFESHPLSSMVAAALPQQMASTSSAGGRCGHYFCQDCMRRYACEQVQVRGQSSSTHGQRPVHERLYMPRYASISNVVLCLGAGQHARQGMV
jgi:hypothetical protein